VESKKGRVSEEKVVQANYVIGFFEEVAGLTDASVRYHCLFADIGGRLVGQDVDFDKALDDAEKNDLKVSVQNVRYFVELTFVHYRVFMKALGKAESADIVRLRSEINKCFVIKRDVLEQYVVEVNFAIADSVMRSLLETSQALMARLYDGE